MPRPPLTYRITPRQWLAVDIAAAVLGMLVITFGLRVVHGPRFGMPTAGVAAATVAATLPGRGPAAVAAAGVRGRRRGGRRPGRARA